MATVFTPADLHIATRVGALNQLGITVEGARMLRQLDRIGDEATCGEAADRQGP